MRSRPRLPLTLLLDSAVHGRPLPRLLASQPSGLGPQACARFGLRSSPALDEGGPTARSFGQARDPPTRKIKKLAGNATGSESQASMLPFAHRLIRQVVSPRRRWPPIAGTGPQAAATGSATKTWPELVETSSRRPTARPALGGFRSAWVTRHAGDTRLRCWSGRIPEPGARPGRCRIESCGSRPLRSRCGRTGGSCSSGKAELIATAAETVCLLVAGRQGVLAKRCAWGAEAIESRGMTGLARGLIRGSCRRAPRRACRFCLSSRSLTSASA